MFVSAFINYIRVLRRTNTIHGLMEHGEGLPANLNVTKLRFFNFVTFVLHNCDKIW